MSMLHSTVPTAGSAVDYTHQHTPTAVGGAAPSGDDTAWNSAARANFNGWAAASQPTANTAATTGITSDGSSAFTAAAAATEHLPHGTGADPYATFNGMAHHQYPDLKPPFYYAGQYSTGIRGLAL